MAVIQSRAIASIEDLSTQVYNAKETVTSQAATGTADAVNIEELNATATARADATATATAIYTGTVFAWTAPISISINKASLQIEGIDLREKSFTIAAWAKREGNSNFFIIGQGTTLANQGLHIGFRDGPFTCGFWGNDIDTVLQQQDDVGAWHHWACTIDVPSTCEEQKPCRTIYKDGVKVTTKHSGDSTGDYQGSGPLLIGNSPKPTQTEGSIAGVAIYTRVLSAIEIDKLKNATDPRQ